MLGRPDCTAAFLRLLVFAAIEHLLIDSVALQKVSESHSPFDPMDASLSQGSPEDRFAFGRQFQKMLHSKEEIDWDRIRIEARRLEKLLDRKEQDRLAANANTRWLPLDENNPFFDAAKWSSVWSRRDLESLVGLFCEDGFYFDATLDCPAQAKTGLRNVFSQFFHAFDGRTTITSAKFDPTASEVSLEWVRTGSRIPGTDLKKGLGSRTVRGTSQMWLVCGKISTCLDRTNKEDLEQIALQALAFQGTIGSGAVTETNTMVTVNDVRLLKTIQLKKPFATAGRNEPS
jgi:hypothetical protein